MKPGAELIIDEPMAKRAQRYFSALQDAAPSWVRTSRGYTGSRRVVITYGAGAEWRQEFLRRHRAAGGRAVIFDLAYWDRVASLRLSLDGLHPTPEHIALTGGLVPRRSFVLREDHNPAGHVLLAGVGRKTALMLGEAPHAWERKALRRIQAQLPGARVVWRPKGPATPLGDLPLMHGGDIADALRGARLVVCRTSNVAVDACVAGVPVWCDGGAASALYAGCQAPSIERRRAFLHALSWWEWRVTETAAAWGFIRDVIQRTGDGL